MSTTGLLLQEFPAVTCVPISSLVPPVLRSPLASSFTNASPLLSNVVNETRQPSNEPQILQATFNLPVAQNSESRYEFD